MEKLEFNSATGAFEHLYNQILTQGETVQTKSWTTKALYNVGFYLNNSENRLITTPWRKWNHNYASLEWEWYLSEDRNVKEIGKKAKIWLEICDENFEVNSNYGWQWNREEQLRYIINCLVEDPFSRRASISIYDAKEHEIFKKDTPCTYAINFRICQENKLHMSVLMRSCDLVYGFCNDQYCFSRLHAMVLAMLEEASGLEYSLGRYYHFTNDLHIYQKHWDLKDRYCTKTHSFL